MHTSRSLPDAHASPTGREVIRALERPGFHQIRVGGSHHYPAHSSAASRRATVPVYGVRTLHPSIL
ncbi:MAG TPA: type II toxin-antitoxin system HicA family toxin [Dehalococcoidia bacterium]|nr:type II toxin-antitoxin system HicA family toxin [Dehalococcoidia bacterium]